jgi:hypothetical protein
MRILSPGYDRPIRCNGMPRIPSLSDPIRPVREVDLLQHYATDLAVALDASPCTVDMGVDPLVNGNFEGAAGPPPAGWLQFNATSSRVANPRPGSTGNFSCKVEWAGFLGGLLYQTNVIPIGSTAMVSGWYYVVNGAVLDVMWGNVTFTTLPNVGAWTYFSVINTNGSADTHLRFQCNNFAAGREFYIDDIWLTPLNVTTLHDRTRRGGRSPTQATTIRRPVLTANDTPSGKPTLVFNGTSMLLVSPAFAFNQPLNLSFGLHHTNTVGTQVYLTDPAGGPYIYSGGADLRLKVIVAGPVINTLYSVGFNAYSVNINGGNSSICNQMGTFVSGNLGVGNWNGIVIGGYTALFSMSLGRFNTIFGMNRTHTQWECYQINKSVMRRLGI